MTDSSCTAARRRSPQQPAGHGSTAAESAPRRRFQAGRRVERTARGIYTIFFEQLRNGRPAPSYARSDATGVVVVIPGREANLDFARLLVTEAQHEHDLSLDELLVLDALWQERTLATSDAAQLIQKPDGDARAVLHRLVEAGFVEERGQKKGRTWHVSAATYRAWVTRPRTCASVGSNPCNRSRWFCSTSKGTDGRGGDVPADMRTLERRP